MKRTHFRSQLQLRSNIRAAIKKRRRSRTRLTHITEASTLPLGWQQGAHCTSC